MKLYYEKVQSSLRKHNEHSEFNQGESAGFDTDIGRPRLWRKLSKVCHLFVELRANVYFTVGKM